jgi:hypothetical protein
MCQHVPRGVWLDPRYYGNLPAPWFSAELLLSIGLPALGIFSGRDWNGHPFVDWYHERLWSWGDSLLVYYGKNGILDAYAKVKRRLLALPTSRDAPHKLAASYRLTSLAPETTLHTRDFLLCHISVVNTGGAVWLDRAQWEKGEVRLRWRWFAEGQEGHLIEGGCLPGYPVLPVRAMSSS